MAAKRKAPKARRSPAERRAALRLEARSRSHAAKLGWRTRRFNAQERERLHARRSEAAKRGWALRENKARFEALGEKGGLRGNNYKNWKTLDRMIRNNDNRWLKYHERMRRAGFSERSIFNRWFSP